MSCDLSPQPLQGTPKSITYSSNRMRSIIIRYFYLFKHIISFSLLHNQMEIVLLLRERIHRKEMQNCKCLSFLLYMVVDEGKKTMISRRFPLSNDFKFVYELLSVFQLYTYYHSYRLSNRIPLRQ